MLFLPHNYSMMVNFKNITTAISLLALLVACNDSTRQSQEQTSSTAPASEEIVGPEDATTAILEQYHQLKSALVETDAGKAQKAAAAFVERTKEIKEKDVPEVYLNAVEAIQNDVAAIVASEDIEEQRALFVPLTDGVYSLTKEFPAEEPVYYAYCPMAFDDKGGYWLTKEKEILNPYFGDKMLRCGVIKETIKGR